MYALLALTATVLTSFLPILNKQILRDARPALVAWAINAFSLPVLAVGTFLLTQCKLTPFSCTTHLPQIDSIFIIALFASVVLNWAATRCHPECCVRPTASKQAELFYRTRWLSAERNLASTPCLREKQVSL